MHDRPGRLLYFFANYYLLINYHLLVSVIYRKNKYKKLVKVLKRQLRQWEKTAACQQVEPWGNKKVAPEERLAVIIFKTN
jgi:hypothetical protein